MEGNMSCGMRRWHLGLSPMGSIWTKYLHLSKFLYAPSFTLTHQEITSVVRQDVTKLDTRRTWLESPQILGTKMASYWEYLFHTTHSCFIVWPKYVDTSIAWIEVCHRLDLHLFTPSWDRDSLIGELPWEERVCQVCHFKPKTKEHYMGCCMACYEVGGCFRCLFRVSPSWTLGGPG